MKIGLISDTHGYLEESICTHFSTCDEVWHLGDVGSPLLLDKLQETFKLRTVFGNIDGYNIRIRTEEALVFTLEDKRFLLIHIAGKPPHYTKQVRSLIEAHHPDVLICGHSHILKIAHDTQNKLLFVNPGAAGKHGFHKKKTLIRFEIEHGRIFNMEVIELGNRSTSS